MWEMNGIILPVISPVIACIFLPLAIAGTFARYIELVTGGINKQIVQIVKSELFISTQNKNIMLISTAMLISNTHELLI